MPAANRPGLPTTPPVGSYITGFHPRKGSNDEESMFLVEYAPGKSAEIYAHDSGVLLEADSKIRLFHHLLKTRGI